MTVPVVAELAADPLRLPVGCPAALLEPGLVALNTLAEATAEVMVTGKP